jgi:hypothetical protein
MILKIPISKITRAKWTVSVAQIVECLHCPEVLNETIKSNQMSELLKTDPSYSGGKEPKDGSSRPVHAKSIRPYLKSNQKSKKKKKKKRLGVWLK